MSFLIDNFHELSSYTIDKNKKSIMNETFRKMLHFPDSLRTKYEPSLLKKSFETRFEVELHSRIRKILRELYGDLQMDEIFPNVICKDVSGPFGTIIGVDNFNYGWNIAGLNFTREVPIEPRSYFYPIFEKLLYYFYENYHFQPFYGKTTKEIEKIFKEITIRKRIKIEDWELEEIYQYEKMYPNSFLFIIQKLYQSQIRYWEQEKYVKPLRSIVCKELDIPEIDDLRCNNNILYLYSKKKINIPPHKKGYFFYLRKNKRTDFELNKYQNYSPSFLEDEHNSIKVIEKNDKLHPEYKRDVWYQGHKFSSILECLHYRILIEYTSKMDAILKSKKLTFKDWDFCIHKKFKSLYSKEVDKRMNHLDKRLSLLMIKENNIKNNDQIEPLSGYQDNFLGKVLTETKREMKEYLPKENFIEYEMIIFHLKYWIELWEDSKITEKEKISSFFKIWFPYLEYEEGGDSSIIFPINLERSENHDMIYCYMKSFSRIDILTYEEIEKVWIELMTEDKISYLLDRVSLFHNFFSEMTRYFKIDIPDTMYEFKDRKNLSFLQYVSLKYFLYF